MELRVLQYFLAVAREESITAAAQSLGLTQPTLSRQLRDLELELGKLLFVRSTPGGRKIILTDEGIILRKRAEEILALVDKTEQEVTARNDVISGPVYIGSCEAFAVRHLAQAAASTRAQYPLVQFHFSTGKSSELLEQLDKGLLDFVLLPGETDEKYAFLSLPLEDTWGVLLRRDHPLAKKSSLRPRDLWDQPLLLSEQTEQGDPLSLWFQRPLDTLDLAAHYDLAQNASLLVGANLGCALTLDKLTNVTGLCEFCFRPLDPPVPASVHLAWKRYQVFSKAADTYLRELRSLTEKL